jgi:hypothetical protein
LQRPPTVQAAAARAAHLGDGVGDNLLAIDLEALDLVREHTLHSVDLQSAVSDRSPTPRRAHLVGLGDLLDDVGDGWRPADR